MEIDDMGQTTTTDSSDYQMSTPEPDALQKLGYYGPGVLAFPQSLEVFNVEGSNWYWNASCWVNNRHLDAVECNQICSFFQNYHGWAPSTGSLPAIQLGTSEDMIGRSMPRFSTYVVFPRANDVTLRSEEFMRLWTDSVMVPSLLHASRKRHGVPSYARTYRAIKMVSDCQRIVSSQDVPDTPISIRVRWDELGDLWQTMQTVVRSELPPELQEMFLVVVAGKDSDSGMQCFGSDLRSFWSHFSARFNKAINIEHMATDYVQISPREYYGMY
jgi:hypothetical protein